MMHCQYFETGVYKYDRRNLFAVPRKIGTINHTKKKSMRAGVKSSCSLVKKKNGRVGKKYHTVVLSAPGRHFKNQEHQNPKLPYSMKK